MHFADLEICFALKKERKSGSTPSPRGASASAPPNGQTGNSTFVNQETAIYQE
jgi:hypothetical protein